jgi:hypothetical protein
MTDYNSWVIPRREHIHQAISLDSKSGAGSRLTAQIQIRDSFFKQLIASIHNMRK